MSEDYMNFFDDQDDHLFLTTYKGVLREAAELVEDRTTSRDTAISIMNKYPHGISDLTGIIFDKTCRILSIEDLRPCIPLREELIDIINYAAFCYAYSVVLDTIDRIDNPNIGRRAD